MSTKVNWTPRLTVLLVTLIVSAAALSAAVFYLEPGVTKVLVIIATALILISSGSSLVWLRSRS